MAVTANPLWQKSLTGDALTLEEAREILLARGADLSLILAGAHRLREASFGQRAELCSIINAKSGHCGENCAFCAQSSHHATTAPVFPLRAKETIVAGARQAQHHGSRCFGIVTSGTRIAAGAELDVLLDAIREIRATTNVVPAVSLGLLDHATAKALVAAGCVTYHHNLETARSFFPRICTTHDYEDDVRTIRIAKDAGLQVCCGGIFGLGESLDQRIELALTLRELDVDSVPVNFLNPIAGTPLANHPALPPLDCLRIVAMLRYLLPDKRIAVCGGRQSNLRELQSWIFMAGASGVMVGDYLTTSGRRMDEDLLMFHDLEMEIDGCC